MKFVLRNCAFDGVAGWYLARHHHDAQFYFLNCGFSRSMIDRAPYRVIYPLGNATATAKDIAKNQELDKTNVWGERAYYLNCHREGGDYAWHADNLARAPGAPAAAGIDAAWTFGGTWNPERTVPPTIARITPEERRITVRFSENVSVRGKPRLLLKDGGFAVYQSGGGSDTLVFASKGGTGAEVASLDLNGGAVIATEAAATIRAFEPQPQPPR
jgi:pectinesterase